MFKFISYKFISARFFYTTGDSYKNLFDPISHRRIYASNFMNSIEIYLYLY